MIRAIFRKIKVSKIGVARPQPRPDRHGVAVVAIVRNEARHIGEWARFHHAVGVRHFIIYDDASGDGTQEILRRALPQDALTLVPWAQRLTDSRLGREIHNQILAYAHAVGNFGGAFRWMAFIDADEFLVPVGAETLPEALAPLHEIPNISLPWHMFGPCGHDAPPAGGVVRNYLVRARDPMGDAPGLRAFKVIADPCRLTAMRVHSVETDGSGDTWNDTGRRTPLARRDARDFYSASAVQLNHYYTRSRQELEAKIARGPNLVGKAAAYRRKVLRTVESIERDVVEDRRALEVAVRHGLAED